MAFSVVKGAFRKKLPTEGVIDRVNDSLKHLTIDKIKNMFRHVTNHIQSIMC
jgi:hypothetical protein